MHGGRAPPHPRRRTPARRAGGAVRSRCVWGRRGGKAPCLKAQQQSARGWRAPAPPAPCCDGGADPRPASAQVKDRDEQLAKAKRMMVALNNKFKAKFAKLEETYKAKAAAQPGEGDGQGALAHELQEARDKLAASQRAVDELQQALAAARAGGGGAEGTEDKEGEIAELREAVEERDAIIEKAKEKYQEMGRKARAAVEERDAEIASLQEQLQQVVSSNAHARARRSAIGASTPWARACMPVGTHTQERAVLNNADLGVSHDSFTLTWVRLVWSALTCAHA